MGIRKSDNHQLFTRTCINQTTIWIVHSLNTFGAWMSHGQTRTHKDHHGLDLGEAITFPLIVYFMSGHGVNTQMAFGPETPKWESQNSQYSRNFEGP